MAEGYELRLIDGRDEYQVFKAEEYIGKIAINMKYVKAYSGTDVRLVPYDIYIDVIETKELLPLELFKKWIMATTSLTEPFIDENGELLLKLFEKWFMETMSRTES